MDLKSVQYTDYILITNYNSEQNKFKMDKYFNNESLFKVILKWKWHIIAVTIVAAVAGAIFSGPTFITPRYKSETILYPSNVSSYSDETFTEQMLQIMESQDIMDSVVEKFDLVKHYDIDKADKHWKTNLIGEYQDRVSISKTPYDAVRVKVMDKDPQMACDMVNEIIRLYDNKVGTLHKIKRKEAVDMYKKQLDDKLHFIDSLKQELHKITDGRDVLSYTYLSKDNSSAYFTNNGKDLDNVTDAMLLVEYITNETNSLTDIKSNYELELRFYNANMTFSNVVSHPFVADKKSTPVRWIIVALSGIGAFLLSILVVAAIEKIEVKE